MTTLLLHPIGLDRSTWDRVPIADALAIDLPGHGKAPAADLATLGDVADRVVAALPDDLGPVDLVGVSLGGMVALHAALRHPARVRSIVVACAPAATPTEAMLRRAEDTARLGMAGMLDETLTRWFSPEVLAARPRFVADTERRLLADDPGTVADYWLLIAGHDVLDRLDGLRPPVTVIAGSGDVSVPPAAARALADGVPGARCVELPGAHMLHLEQPAPFAAAVAAHLAGLG